MDRFYEESVYFHFHFHLFKNIFLVFSVQNGYDHYKCLRQLNELYYEKFAFDMSWCEVSWLDVGH